MRVEKMEEKSELESFLKSSLYTFISGFTSYLNENSINEQMDRFFSDLKLELYIWSDRSDNKVEDSLSDQLSIKRAKIGSGTEVQVDKVEEQDPKRIKEYIRNSKGSDYAISPVAKVKYNAAKGIVGEVCVMWGIDLGEEKGKAKEFMAEVLLKFLYKCFGSYHLDFLETVETAVWKNKAEHFSFNLINAYVMNVFSTLPIPPEGVIREIAFRHYEKSEVCATVYFVEEEVCQKVREEHRKGVVWIDKKHGLAKDLGKKCDVPAVRKMLETCKNGNALLVQTESGERSGGESTNSEYPIVAVMSKELAETCPFWLQLEFTGRGEWRLLVSGEVVLEYRNGVYTVNTQHLYYNINKKVEEVAFIHTENKAKFIDIFECLDQCPHGALMILGHKKQIQNEVKRLADLAKGTMIEKLELAEKENLSLLQGLATIDGAVMVDYNGDCYGSRIILDGRAKLRGDIGRGSRYNSALNYATNHKCYAVVFSEDKENGIQIIDGKKEFLKLAKKRYCSNRKKGL